LPQSQCIRTFCARTSQMRQTSTLASTQQASSCTQSAKDLGNWRLTVDKQHSAHQVQVVMQSGASAVSEHCKHAKHITRLQSFENINSTASNGTHCMLFYHTFHCYQSTFVTSGG